MAATTLLLREGRCCVGRIAIFLGGIHRDGAPSAVYQFPGEGGREGGCLLYAEWLFGNDGRARSVAMAIGHNFIANGGHNGAQIAHAPTSTP